ncbi:MAG: hypothetical protein LUQ71_08685 [Methanoregula sp.]|nr:hypothetical protein [Methanoregula sp.]
MSDRYRNVNRSRSEVAGAVAGPDGRPHSGYPVKPGSPHPRGSDARGDPAGAALSGGS